MKTIKLGNKAMETLNTVGAYTTRNWYYYRDPFNPRMYCRAPKAMRLYRVMFCTRGLCESNQAA